MNANLQALLTQLNASQAVSLPEFISALEQEPDILLSTIFTGTAVPGSSINWKNTVDEAGDMADYQYLLVSNTSSWNFTFTKFSLSNIALYLRVEDTDETGSIISAVITGVMTDGTVSMPVLMTLKDFELSVYQYINAGTTVFYEYSVLESFFDAPLLHEYYPESMKNLSGLNCLLLGMKYSTLDQTMESYSITSPAAAWVPAETSIFNFSDCTMTCLIALPYETDSVSFAVNGALTYTCSATGVSSSVPTFADMAFIFQNNGLSILTEISNLSGDLFDSLRDLYISTSEGVVSSINVISTQDQVTPVPPVVLKELDMVFYYTSGRCDLSGTLLAGSLELGIKTMLDLEAENHLSMIAFDMQNDIDEGVDFNLSDMSLFGLSVADYIPGISGLGFTIYDFNFWADIQPAVSIQHASLTIGSENSWQILPSFSINNALLNLNYAFGDNVNLYYGEVSGEMTIGSTDVYMSVVIPERVEQICKFQGYTRPGFLFKERTRL